MWYCPYRCVSLCPCCFHVITRSYRYILAFLSWGKARLKCCLHSLPLKGIPLVVTRVCTWLLGISHCFCVYAVGSLLPELPLGLVLLQIKAAPVMVTTKCVLVHQLVGPVQQGCAWHSCHRHRRLGIDQPYPYWWAQIQKIMYNIKIHDTLLYQWIFVKLLWVIICIIICRSSCAIIGDHKQRGYREP